MPLTPDELLARFDSLGIKHSTVSHPPVFTVEEAKRLRGTLPGAHVKNLFLRDKKKAMWLLTALEDARIDLRALEAVLGSARLSFGSADRLMEFLGVLPGAVTPLAAVNDTGLQVKVVLHRALLDTAPVNCHPLTNDRTTALAPGDLIAFLRSTGHDPQLIDL